MLGIAVHEFVSAGAPDPTLDDPTLDGEPGLEIDRPGYWRFCIATGSAAQLIADEHPELSVGPDEAFTAGLLHGLGRLALDMILPKALGRAMALAEQRRIDGALAERELLGIDHHTAGKRLAEHWGLPASLRDVIWLHAQPARAIPDLPHAPMIRIVTVAKALCRRLHLGWSGDFSGTPDLDMLCADHALRVSRVRSVVSTLHDKVADRCATLGLERATTPELLMQSLAIANRCLSRTGVQLERRVRAARGQADQLKAIGEFLGATRPDNGVARTLGCVVANASGLLGEGFFGAIIQTSPTSLWRVLQFNANGRVRRDDTLTAPGNLAHLSADLTLESIGLLPWLTDYVLDAVDVRHVRLLRLGGDHQDAAAVVLMHDRPIDEHDPARGRRAADRRVVVGGARRDRG